MRTMHELVADIINLNQKDMELLAEALVWYSEEKAADLEFLLNMMYKEKEVLSVKEYA